MLNGGCLPYTWVVTRFLYTTRESHEHGYFNMMMIVDYANADKDFGAMVGNLEDLGDDIGVRIRCQREEIFTKMHRI